MTTFEVSGEVGGRPPRFPTGFEVGTAGLGDALPQAQSPRRAMDYVVRLYVAGGTPVARRAEASLRKLMTATHGNFDLEVIDVVADPQAAEAAGVLATPLVVREEPAPRRRIVGDLADLARLAEALGIDEHVAAGMAQNSSNGSSQGAR